MTEGTATPSLPKLLAALAVGARSVNNLPLSGKNQNKDDNVDETDSENEEELDDEFNYQMAFPEFNSLCLETRSDLASLLNKALKSSTGQLEQEGDVIDEDLFDFDDPRLWESAAEMCDLLLERVDRYIQNVKDGRAGLDLEQIDTMRQIGTMARNKAKGDFDRIIGSLVEMKKPQITYGFDDDVQNSRTEVFTPTLNSQSLCTLELVDGHGLDGRRYGGSVPDDIIAPTHHYAHPYKEIIESFEYQNEQFTTEKSGIHGRSGTLQNKALASLKGIWIDTESDLSQLAARIENDENHFQEIAIDLEAHSFRSFSGFVCTMQLSLRRPSLPEGSTASTSDGNIESGYDFIIDTLALRSVLNKHFAPIFANPNIVKVMHGADSDVQWLQRDFSIYIVNLFDTGRASRILPHFTSSGLAYLLRKYAKLEADKKHQLSDWRQRPVPDEMLQYAISDTMYLLDVYEKVKLELKENETDDISIKAVLDASRKVCLIRYDKEPFNPNSYKRLITSKRGKRKSAVLSIQQDKILKALYDWRDTTAREEDESTQYVCSNTGLLRIATTVPQNVTALQRCVNPLPPLVLRQGSVILRLVKKCLADGNSEAIPTKKDEVSRELKFQNVDIKNREESQKANRRGMMSPVLGTEALYKQAGWMTPQVQQGTTTSEENSSTSSEDLRSDVAIHSSNSHFHSNVYTPHSLEMRKNKEDKEGQRRGQSVDGLGAARVILNQRKDDTTKNDNSAEMQNKIAQKCAGRIRSDMMSGNQNLLGLVKTASFVDEGEENDEYDEINVAKDAEEIMEENEIPKSMKEIYRYVFNFVMILKNIWSRLIHTFLLLSELVTETEDGQKRLP
jgi:exosome complex exonuclease RRP6